MAAYLRVFDPTPDNPNYSVTIIPCPDDKCRFTVVPAAEEGGYPSITCVSIQCPCECQMTGPTIIYNPATGEKAWEEYVCACPPAG